MAIDNGNAVQEIKYEALKPLLLKYGQRLQF
jgi:hypothetical protein